MLFFFLLVTINNCYVSYLLVRRHKKTIVPVTAMSITCVGTGLENSHFSSVRGKPPLIKQTLGVPREMRIFLSLNSSAPIPLLAVALLCKLHISSKYLSRLKRGDRFIMK